MEALAVISLVGNIIQFVDFGSKLISKSVQLHRSSDGALPENIDTETATNHLLLLNNKLKGSANTTGDTALERLCISCSAVAAELLEALGKLKVEGRQKGWKSMKKAIWSAWSKEYIQGIEKRLASLREELNLHIVMDLRERISQFKLEQSNQFKGLDLTTQHILDAIESRQDVFQMTFHTQIASVGARVVDEHGITRAKISEEIRLLRLDGDLAEQERRLAELHVDDAAFNSRLWEHEPRCLPETRVDLLQQIKAWSEDPNGACIFWLNGMAGTGKSTIARTVARAFADQKQLGASFFFSRGQRDLDHAGKFFTTLAAQLSYTIPALKPYIYEAMAENFNISSSGLSDQWKRLIFRPLSNLKESSFQSQILIFVIDALDECEDDRDIRLILQLLAEAAALNTIQLRAFVTSRPEIPIRLGFRAMSGILHHDLLLHDVPRTIVDGDISAFFRHEIKGIRDEFELPVHWPGEHNIDLLVQRADGLFIYAATVCRFIKEDGQWLPQDLLSLFLPSDTTSDSLMQKPNQITHKPPTWELDGIYLQILEYSFKKVKDERDRLKLAEDFRKVVGSIAILSEPLSATVLAKLLAVRKDTINLRIRHLHSVLHAPEDQGSPIRLLHPSFRDFLLDKQRCRNPQLWVDEKKTHGALTKSCLELMSNHLRRDMCNLQLPGALVTELEDSKVEKCLPLDVQYACRYWVYHLQRGNIGLYDHGCVHIFLQKHFLHWLEALSLMGNLSDGVIMVRILESMITPKSSTNSRLLPMTYDAKRFILNYRFIIEKAPLQIYYSALLFSPKRSEIRRRFLDKAPCWIASAPMVQEDWNPSLQALEGHSGSVNAVAFSPGAQLLASGSDDSTVRLWDAMTGVSRGALEGHSGWVRAVAFSPDGQLLASASDDCTVRLWDATTGVLHGVLEGHSRCVNMVAFSPDGQILASVSDDSMVRLWDATTGASCGTLEGHTGSAWAIAFSPDGQLLASASGDRTARLWDTTTGALRYILEGHSGRVWAVAFSPDGRLLASASGDETVRIWDAMTGALRCILEGHLDWVNTVAFSPDGQLLISASEDCTVRLWDATTGASCGSLEGHTGPVRAVAFSPDGRLLASASGDGTVMLWDATTEASRGTLEGHSDSVWAIAFSPDGQLLASASSDSTVRLWDATTGASHGATEGHSDRVTAVAFSPDGQLLASASGDSTAKLWDATTRASHSVLEGHSGWINTVVFSPDGQLLASASNDRTVRLWDATTGASHGVLEGHSRRVSMVAFSPDGRLLASASDDGTVRLWDTTTGASCGTLKGHTYSVSAISFSPDGQLLASASEDNTVRLWDAATGALRDILEGHTGPVTAVAFSPDGQLLASTSHDSTARLWDATTGALRDILEGRPDRVRAVAFSPDSQLLSSASYNTVRLWDATTGTLRVVLENHSDLVRAIAFSPDGQLLASASDDRLVWLWDATTGAPYGALEGHTGSVLAVTFSPDSQLLASASADKTAGIWRVEEKTTHGISFSSDGPHVKKAQGLLELRCFSPSVSCPDFESPNSINIRRHWVSWGSTKILWLPPDYREVQLNSGMGSNVLEIQHPSGRVTFMEFDPVHMEALSKLSPT